MPPKPSKAACSVKDHYEELSPADEAVLKLSLKKTALYIVEEEKRFKTFTKKLSTYSKPPF